MGWEDGDLRFFHFKRTYFISNALFSFQMDLSDCGVGFFHFKWTRIITTCIFFASNGLVIRSDIASDVF